MPLIKQCQLVTFLLAISTWAAAKTNPECLRHLGGTGYDVNCYTGLSIDVEADSKQVYTQLAESIPQGNQNRKLLDQYMSAQASAERFCILDKEAGTDWKPSPSPNTYNMWDAVYAGCVYETRKQQNARLHDLLENYRSPD